MKTMCGLISYVGMGPPDAARVQAGLTALERRGPDDQGLWQGQGVALGHTRLAIVDAAGGRQPVRNEDGSVVAVVNGEFYGYALLRLELQQRGHRFLTMGDSEVLVHLYEELGRDALQRLRGEFAFVLWDERKGELWAARDRFGIKPLVYAYDEACGGWWIASRAKALFAAGVRAGWNEASFYHACCTQYPPLAGSLFAGVEQLAPGHDAIWRRDGLSRPEQRCYWSWPRPGEMLNDAEVVDDFAQALDESVRLRLPQGVRCAFQLSGGIDSASVLALGRQALDGADAFTIGFSGFPSSDYDESELARELAEFIGADWHVRATTSEQLLETLESAVWHSEGVAVNAHLSGKFLLAQRIHEAGYKVVLTGEGADEVLAGYPHFRQDVDPQRYLQLIEENPVSAGILVSSGEPLGLAGVERELGWVPSFLRAKAALGRRLQSLMKDEFLAGWRQRDCFSEMLEGVDLGGLDRWQQSRLLWSRSALCNYILHTLGDGCEMAHAVEGRLPFLDHVLVERLAHYGPHWFIHEDWEKRVLREAMAPLLPEWLRKRRKHPFMAPSLAGLQARLLETLEESPLVFCDPARVRARLAEVNSLPVAQQREWEPVWMWMLTAHLLQKGYRLS